MQNTPRTLLTCVEAAARLGVSTSFLEKDRWRGAGIPYLKIGKSVRYTPEDLDAYLQTRVRSSTTEDQMKR